MLSNRGLGIKAKKCLYKGVIVPTALYGAEAWGMRSAERRKVNVLEIKCLRSLVRMSRMDRVRNEEVHRGGMPLHDAVGINCKKGATTEIQDSGVKYMGTLEQH